MNNNLEAIVDAVKSILTEAIKKNGKASIALSGGSTPKLYIPLIANLNIDWSKVIITLADERAVSPDDRESNQYLNQHLIQNAPMESAKFIGFSKKKQNYDEINLNKIEQSLSEIKQPLDLILLGMGDDGHIASLFPQDKAIQSTEPLLIKAQIPPLPHPQIPRISLSPQAIKTAKNIFLIFKGKSKQEIWQKTKSTNRDNYLEIPARILLEQPQLKIFDLTNCT